MILWAHRWGRGDLPKERGAGAESAVRLGMRFTSPLHLGTSLGSSFWSQSWLRPRLPLVQLCGLEQGPQRPGPQCSRL